MVVLEEKREQVRMLEKKLADLNSTLDSAQAKKKQLENEVNMCSNKLSKAKRLIGKTLYNSSCVCVCVYKLKVNTKISHMEIVYTILTICYC